MSHPRIAAVILAAGKGTRLKSERPKVLHEVCGRPMLAYVIDACREAEVSTCLTVVGHGKDEVIGAFADDADGIVWVEQAEQRGTGHAVMVCREQLAGFDHAVILCGDGPLIRPDTIRQLVERHLTDGAAATLATAEISDPTGYGRIVRDAAGRLRGIVEHRDCTGEQRAIREVNPSYYCFRVADLLRSLDRISPDNAKNEYYLTDTLGLLIEDGAVVTAITAVPPEDIFSINSRRDLSVVNGVMRDRINARWMDDGVTIVDPATTWIDARARIGADTVIHPHVHVSGAARVGRGCSIGPFAHVGAGEEVPDGATRAFTIGGAA